MEPGISAYLITSVFVQVALLYSASQSAWQSRAAIWAWIVKSWKRIRAFSTCACAPQTGDDKRVMEGVCQFRCWVADRMATYFCTVFSLAVLSVQINVLMGGAGWVTDGQKWVVLVMLGGSVALKLMPDALMPWCLNAFYIFSSLVCIAYVSSISIPAQSFAMFSLTGTVFVRLPAVFFATRIKVVLFGNFLSLLHSLWRAITEDFVNPCNGNDQSTFAVRQELLLVLNVIGFSLIMNRILQQKAELELERGKVASQLTAASSLLRLTCDAVIELDNDLCLLEDSPELAYMLMRSGPRAYLKGANFLDFMANDDSARARDFLTSEIGRPSSDSLTLSPNRQILARAFHTRLMDSYNTKICMEVFQVRYSKLDGQQCNLLGLRDFTDVKPLAAESTADAVAESGHPLTSSLSSVSVQEDEVEGSQLGESLDSDSEVDGMIVQKMESSGSLKRANEICLLIDVEGLIVHAASSPCTCLAGKSLKEVFPSPHTTMLLQSVYSEATSRPQEETFNRILTYQDLPFLGVCPGTISGTMRVTRTRLDQIQILMLFTERPDGRQGSSSLRSTGSAGRGPLRVGPLTRPSTLTQL